MRFDIAYGRTGPLLTATGMPPSRAYLEIGDVDLHVHMSWAFSAKVPLASITNVEALSGKKASIGVHGWNGKWLVNGQQDQLVRIDIDPAAAIKAKVGPVPVKLTELTVSVTEPDAFVTTLTAACS